MSKKLLIIFVRNPELGQVKTRLAKTVGNEVALAIYFQLLKHTHSISQNLNADKVIYYSSDIDDNDLWSNENYSKAVQVGDDLGEKMSNAVQTAFSKGYQQVCIIGSDCMELNTPILERAFSALNNHDTVIGAAEDGGYYLLGMTKFSPEFFENKQWSSDEVFISTMENFDQLGLSYHELPVLKDVDTEKDLGSWATVFDSNYLAD